MVTGARGMLGRAVVAAAPAGAIVVGVDRDEAELSNAAAVAELFAREGSVGAVIHCAGYTAVDAAESDEAGAWRDNVDAMREVAAACARTNAAFLGVSTDYVFDGLADRPYRENDTKSPASVYGRSKLAGERAARTVHPKGTRIVRTAWLYGPHGGHFPQTILRLARERTELKVVADQRGSPTSTLELAPVLWELLDAPPDVYHAAGDGDATWFDVAQATLELAGVADVGVMRCTTAEFPRPAPRPPYAVLDCAKLEATIGSRLRPWRVALADYLENHE